MKNTITLLITLLLAPVAFAADAAAPQWQEVELTFTAARDTTNPYTDSEAWADFRHDDGTRIRRPMFWDGGHTFRVRFASTKSSGTWRWTTSDREGDSGLGGHSGTLAAALATPEPSTIFTRHGFWSIPPGGRNLIHADGRPRLLCADTAWALPWRATVEQAEIYARDRQAKGFNAVLLMTVQPDMDCQGPRSRTEDLGFDVGFEDLPKGTLRRLHSEYFQMFDRLTDVLVAHGIAPVYQPVFHGYGWKGRRTAGNVVSAEDYARYCRYLVARYGARPAIWLLGGDGPGTDPTVVAQLDRAGQTIEAWDAYQQPTGIHYAPHSLFRTHQDKAWLDFQWCQTGHNGEHVPERVADMFRNTPVKAVANGEPTYENIGKTGRGAGWWQGHEAWCNLAAGGTMGLVYGAGSLWQWRLHTREPDHASWCTAPGAGWREALEFEGSRYPGIAAKIFDGLPFADMRPNWTYTYGRRGLTVPGKLFVLYLPEGGSTGILSLAVPRAYRIYDPRTGLEVGKGRLPDQAPVPFNSGSTSEPRVAVFTAEASSIKTAEPVSVSSEATGQFWRMHWYERGLAHGNPVYNGRFRVNSPEVVLHPEFGKRVEARENGMMLIQAEEDLSWLTRAELYLETWGGHPGTANKRVTVNGRSTYYLPRVGTEEMNCTYSYPLVELRISDLINGYNAFQFALDQGNSFWGHMIVDNACLRVALTNGHPDLVKAGLDGFRASVKAQPSSSDAEGFELWLDCPAETAIASVDFEANYFGYDENGNTLTKDWHGFTKARQPVAILGAVRAAPFHLIWPTDMLPTQRDVAVRARIHFTGHTNLVYVTPATPELEIPERAASQVILYQSHDLPKEFWSRANRKKRCTIYVDVPLARIEKAELHVNTWTGGSGTVAEYFKLNGHHFPVAEGAKHELVYSRLDVPPQFLRQGINEIELLSDTEHHGIEILLPGPCLMVRARN